MIKLTIFTPTYNRKYILPELYKSLCEQTDKNFYWLIVDDGSTDNTDNLVSEWKKENKINIEYYKKENGGKHTTIDFANKHCKTDYITCIDSDDLLKKESVKSINSKIKKINNEKDIAGFVSIRDMRNEKAEITKDLICKFDTLQKMFGHYPETTIVLKTNIANESHFPIIREERFITESVYYNPIFQKYNVMIVPEKYVITVYIEDGYTAQGINLFFKNPKGYLYALKQDAFYEKKLKSKIGLISRYYAWKKTLNLTDNFKKDYKLNFVFLALGKILACKFEKEYKKAFEEFKKKAVTNGK